MGDRRMFDKDVVMSDQFLDLPTSARALYFAIGINCDDDGMTGSARGIMRQCGASDDDMKILLAKGYLIAFDSGVIAQAHWHINNYIRPDRYKPSKFVEEFSHLRVNEKGIYEYSEERLPSGYQVVTKRLPVGIPKSSQVNLSQVKSSKDNISQDNSNKDNLNQFELGESIEDLLTEEEKMKLLKEIPRFHSLCLYIDYRIKEKPKHPYNYILKVAEETNWKETHK